MEHKVTGCEDCPMFEQQDIMLCNHPKASYQLPTPLNPIPEGKPIEMDSSGSGEEIDLDYVEWVVTPEWCPLKKEPITIMISK